MENSPPSIFSKHLRTSRSHPLAPTFPIKRFFARAADAKTPATPAEFPSLTMRILPADGIFEIFMLHPTQPALRAVCDNGFRFSIIDGVKNSSERKANRARDFLSTIKRKNLDFYLSSRGLSSPHTLHRKFFYPDLPSCFSTQSLNCNFRKRSLQRGGSPHNAPNADFRTRGRRDSAPPTPRSIREFSGKSFCSARRRRVRGNSGSLDAARFPRHLTPGCGSCSRAS